MVIQIENDISESEEVRSKLKWTENVAMETVQTTEEGDKKM